MAVGQAQGFWAWRRRSHGMMGRAGRAGLSVYARAKARNFDVGRSLVTLRPAPPASAGHRQWGGKRHARGTGRASRADGQFVEHDDLERAGIRSWATPPKLAPSGAGDLLLFVRVSVAPGSEQPIQRSESHRQTGTGAIMKQSIKSIAVIGFLTALAGCSDNGRYQLVLGQNGALIRVDTRDGGIAYMIADPKTAELITLPEHRRRYPQ